MATDTNNLYNQSNLLNTWFKIRAGERLDLSDAPELISYRWNYFKDNWEKIKDSYVENIANYSDPDLLASSILEFTDFIKIQRTIGGKNPFSNSNILYKFYAIFANTFVDSISLTAEEAAILNAKIDRISSFTRPDFIKIRDALVASRDEIADTTGTSDETYNEIFGRNSQQSLVNIENKHVNQMNQIQSSIKTINYILANIFSINNSFVDPFALARSNANNPNVNIGTYSSGYLTKINYGETLQSLAARTLGSPDSWIDIAIANGLKTPYIDEFGESIPLISNASGNQINLNATDGFGNLNIDKLYVNQIVILQSNTQVFQEQRIITNVKSVPVSGEIVVELDGDSDLERYTTTDGANIRIFKPNTVNSGLYVLIPTGDPLPQDIKTDTPWFLRKSSESEKQQKIDLYLGDDNDLSFSPSGDLNLSYALDNAIQAVRIKMQTEVGELAKHTEFGLVQISGSTTSDIESLKAVLTQSIVDNISADIRFDGINRLDIQYISSDETSNTVNFLNVILEVKIAGSEQVVPISFSVNI